MLQTLFYFILNMSLNGIFIICGILLIRNIRVIPKRLVYIFWTAAFARLCVPFSLSSRWSVFNYTGNLIKRVIAADAIIAGPPLQGMTMANYIGAVDSYAPAEFKTAALYRLFTTGAVVWLTVSIAALLAMVILYWLTSARFKTALLLRDNIYASDILLSPVLIGVLRPRIILPLPLSVDSPEAGSAIAHENVHRKRCDNLWRLLGFAVVCFHWFNPFAWLMLKYFLDDMELSCDEAVVRHYDLKARKAYASALVSFAGDRGFFVSTAFGKSGIKARIVNILNYKRLTVIGTIASALLLLAVAVILATNPQIRG